MRLIDADALEKYLSDAEMEATKRKKYVFASALNVIQGNVRNFPTIEPERKKGKWNQIISIPNDIYGRYYCSECGKEGNPFWYFCPNCGADMRGEQE